LVAGTTAMFDEISSGSDQLEVTAGGIISSSGALVLAGVNNVVQVPGTDSLDVTTIDRSGTISIGTASATGITIGSGGAGGVLTTIAGDLSVTGDETVVGSTVFQDDVTFGNSTGDNINFVGGINTNVFFQNGASRQISVEQEAVDTAGRSLTVFAGIGGDYSASAPGVGGQFIGQGGHGGDTALASGVGAVGGAANVIGGDGGTATGATSVGGAGGDAFLVGGDGGTGTSTNGVGGDARVRGGTGSTNGDVKIGDTNTGQVDIGSSSIDTYVYGELIVSQTIQGPDDGTGVVIGHAGTGASTGSAPQMVSVTTTERGYLTPANGMFVYNTTAGEMQMYSGGSWQTVAASGSPGAGTPNLSWTTNNDGVGTSDEDPYNVLLGGDGGGNLYSTIMRQESTAPAAYIFTQTSTADDYQSDMGTSLTLGPITQFTGTAVDADATFTLRGHKSGDAVGTFVDGVIEVDASAELMELSVGGETWMQLVEASGSEGINFGSATSGGAFLFRGDTFDIGVPTAGLATDIYMTTTTNAFRVVQNTNNYVHINTSTPGIEFGNASTNPTFEFLGTGLTTFANGDVAIGASAMLGGERLRVVGDVAVQGDVGFEAGADRNIEVYQAAVDTTGHGLSVEAGQGGDYSASAAGVGGQLVCDGGDGGYTAQGGDTAGAGGAGNYRGGAGGNATGLTGTGGAGGNAFLVGGAGGTGNTLGGVGGTAYVRGGATGGGANDGDVAIGDSQTNSINIANATDNPATTFLGSGQITMNGNLDAAAGVDVTGGQLTFTGTNIALDPTGNFTLDIDATRNIAMSFPTGQALGVFQINDGVTQYLRMGEVSGEKQLVTSVYFGMDEVSAAPTNIANRGFLYTKDVSGVTELFYTDSGGTETQITPAAAADPEYSGVAGEALNAGDVVCLQWDAGSTSVRVFQCDANVTNRSNAIGITKAAATTGNAVTVQLAGESATLADARWDAVPGTAQVGLSVWMSETPGQMTYTKPTTGGVTQQQIGWVAEQGSGNSTIIIDTSVQLRVA
jgi:hypothetical protein